MMALAVASVVCASTGASGATGTRPKNKFSAVISQSQSISRDTTSTLFNQRFTDASLLSPAPKLSPVFATGIPRGGGSKATSSMVEQVKVQQVLKARRIPWRRMISSLLLLISLVAIWESYNSIGVPFAETVWSLLRGDQSPMPYDYYPSEQDFRVAKSIAAQTAGLIVPSESLPSFQETTIAVANFLCYLFLQFTCPISIQQWLGYIPLESPTAAMIDNTKLALALEVERKSIGSSKVKHFQTIRQLEQMGKTYQFHLDKGRAFLWSPSNNKLSKL